MRNEIDDSCFTIYKLGKIFIVSAVIANRCTVNGEKLFLFNTLIINRSGISKRDLCISATISSG